MYTFFKLNHILQHNKDRVRPLGNVGKLLHVHKVKVGRRKTLPLLRHSHHEGQLPANVHRHLDPLAAVDGIGDRQTLN